MGIEFEIDFLAMWENFMVFASQDPITIAIQLFLRGGWVVFLILFLYGMYFFVFLEFRQGQFAGKWKHVYLAIDIPKENEQTPKAVENIFVALSGVYTTGSLVARYWRGKVTESFSFEIVSLEGYIQFIIRTPTHFRDLIEAAIYAQYPEAEITEVEDYTIPFADVKFPNEKYILWGTELILAKDYPYAIRTYPEFEHGLSQTFLDPMANLLEVLSRFDSGEQLWLQLIVTPQKPGWGEKAKKVVKEIMGQTYTPPETLTDKAIKPVGWLGGAAMTVVNTAISSETPTKEDKEEDQWKMFKISPGERLVFENVQRKLSKHAFRLKFRMIYLSEKEVFNKGKGVGAVMGAIQQFNIADANGFKPGSRTKTAADYYMVKSRVAKRQNNILRYYIKRNNYYGEEVGNMFLNTEELASLWHFPVLTVKAPAVEKIASRRSVPPTRLPYGIESLPIKEDKKTSTKESVPTSAEGEVVIPTDSVGKVTEPTESNQKEQERPRPTPPPNLPTV